MVNESIVLDYYLQLIDDNKIEFLVGRQAGKDAIVRSIQALRDANSIHKKIEAARDLWKLLFEAAMSFLDANKHGYDSLFTYFDEFVEFEELIFASDSFYRDHTIHSLWVYFLGEYLYRKEEFRPFFHDMFEDYKIAGELVNEFVAAGLVSAQGNVATAVGSLEELHQRQGVIRCITALAHDLGYPLKKIGKINKCISSILPHFSIDSYQEFKFNFTASQQPFIQGFLEFISTDFTLNIIEKLPLKYQQAVDSFISFNPRTQEFALDKAALAKLPQEEFEGLKEYITPRLSLMNCPPKFLRYANDFEHQEHGILSAFLLMKKLWFFRNLRYGYNRPESLSSESMDFYKVNAAISIVSAVADHTSAGYQITSINNPSALLTFVDELEEFSRISRANQNRQFINQFCKTNLSVDEGWLGIDFIFDNPEIDNLDPEIAFRGRCKRFLSLFDLPNLDKALKIRLRCIGRLPKNSNVYLLELQQNNARIAVNGTEQEISTYIQSRDI